MVQGHKFTMGDIFKRSNFIWSKLSSSIEQHVFIEQECQNSMWIWEVKRAGRQNQIFELGFYVEFQILT